MAGRQQADPAGQGCSRRGAGRHINWACCGPWTLSPRSPGARPPRPCRRGPVTGAIIIQPSITKEAAGYMAQALHQIGGACAPSCCSRPRWRGRRQGRRPPCTRRMLSEGSELATARCEVGRALDGSKTGSASAKVVHAGGVSAASPRYPRGGAYIAIALVAVHRIGAEAWRRTTRAG